LQPSKKKLAIPPATHFFHPLTGTRPFHKQERTQMFRILRNASTTFYRRQALASSYAAAHFGTLSEMFGEVDESVKETPVVYVHGVARTNYIRGWAWQKVLHMRRRAERRKDNEYSIVIDEDDDRTREKEVQKNDDGTDDDSVANDDDDDEADRLDDRYATKKFQPVKDTVLMYEHDHIYTLGRGAKHKSHLTFLNFDSDPDGERTKVSPEEYEFINLSRKRLHPKRQADDRASLYVNSEQLVSMPRNSMNCCIVVDLFFVGVI
jgi:hypothetical protein